MTKRIVAYEDRSIPQVYINWIYSYSKKNYWKVAGLIDFDDMIQEGYVAFYYCKNRYGEIDPPHLMAMLKLRFFQFIVDTAKKRTGLAEVHPLDNINENSTEESVWDKLLGTDELQSIQVLISEAPELIRKVLSLFVTEDTLKELRAPYKRNQDKTRETTNDRLCRLIGITGDVDLVSMIKNYLSPSY
jgi:hypothetical protein